MREIKLRGKTEQGEWKFGLLTFMFGQHGIVNPEDENSVYLIDKETVGQYTGLKDKNGVEIYEGDIYQFEGHNFAIIHNLGSFGCFEDDLFYPLGDIFYKLGEVIGNIYENPELLEDAHAE